MKVAINTCHGGFGLSMKAIERYWELKGRKCYFFCQDYSNSGQTASECEWLPVQDDATSFGISAFDIPNIQDVLRPRAATGREMAKAERDAYNALWDKHHLGIPKDRSDPLLIQVIEELGKEANDNYADLKIIEIPNDVKWKIEEYDGAEWVAEEHRTWH